MHCVRYSAEPDEQFHAKQLICRVNLCVTIERLEYRRWNTANLSLSLSLFLFLSVKFCLLYATFACVHAFGKLRQKFISSRLLLS